MDDNKKPFKHGTSSAYSYHKCRCPKCVTWKQEWRKKQRESGKEAAQQRAYRERNLEKVRAREAEYSKKRREDPEKYAAYLEYQRQYAADNAEKKREQTRQWREADPHRAWVTQFCGECERDKAPVSAATRKWMTGLAAENPPCAYCGGQWETLDHVIPISKGGDSSRANLLPCCHFCKRSKGATDPYVWAARQAARVGKAGPVPSDPTTGD